METNNIEKFFLNNLLRISILGVILILVSNILFYQEDTLSITTSTAILLTCILCYVIRHKYPTISVLILTSVVLAAMVYQRLASPGTTTTLSIVIIVGFIISVMLRGRIFWVMHAVAITILNTIFIYKLDDPVTAAITYSTLYFILAYATRVLKFNYDKMHQNLVDINIELQQKANEIAVQNEELLRAQDNLKKLNLNLEQIVNERTEKIQIQNEILIKYSYTNAHHLRGPVARLLGLASIYQLETQPDHNFYISKMVDQAHEIDSVVKQINFELASNNVEVTE
jgi:signal transduction histidine kinase